MTARKAPRSTRLRTTRKDPAGSRGIGKTTRRPADRGDQRQCQVLPARPELTGDVDPTLGEDRPAQRESALADGVEHEVVGLPRHEVVAAGGVEDGGGTERAHEFHVLRRAHGIHVDPRATNSWIAAEPIAPVPPITSTRWPGLRSTLLRKLTA